MRRSKRTSKNKADRIRLVAPSVMLLKEAIKNFKALYQRIDVALLQLIRNQTQEIYNLIVGGWGYNWEYLSGFPKYAKLVAEEVAQFEGFVVRLGEKAEQILLINKQSQISGISAVAKKTNVQNHQKSH